MMDLGATICTPRNPDCALLPGRRLVRAPMRRASRSAIRSRRRRPPRPHREGVAYWLEHDGEVLLVRRPAKGLLGGMLALPEPTPPADGRLARKRARSSMSSPISR